MERTTNGFGGMSLPDLVDILNKICGNMTGNANFPQQQAAVTELSTAKAAFMELVRKAAGGSKADIISRDALRAQIVVQLRNLGNEVTAVSQGDVSLLESSGFYFTKEKQPTPPLEKPKAPELVAGVNPGEILCTAKKQIGNERITYMISTNATDENWKTISSSKSKYLFTSLNSGQRYYVKYSLCGVRDQEVISDTVFYTAQ